MFRTSGIKYIVWSTKQRSLNPLLGPYVTPERLRRNHMMTLQRRGCGSVGEISG